MRVFVCDTHYAFHLGSAASIAGYVAGIGDRHCDNFLITSHGRLLLIDFGAVTCLFWCTCGCACGVVFVTCTPFTCRVFVWLAAGTGFGQGQWGLPVPELIPFRLTPMLANVLQPADTTDALKLHMAMCMQALSDSASELLTAMNVFITEPLQDWLKPAGDNKFSGSSSDDASTVYGSQATLSDAPAKWFPLRRIRIAQRKLRCGHPCSIMQEELTENAALRSTLKPVIDYCWGRPSRPRSQKRDPVCESVEEQVSFLVDLATDPAILGVQWRGLATWL